MNRRRSTVTLGLAVALLGAGALGARLLAPEREAAIVVGGPADPRGPVSLAPAGMPRTPTPTAEEPSGRCLVAGLVRRAGRPVEADVEARRVGDVAPRTSGEGPASDAGAEPADGVVLVRARSGSDGRFACPELPPGSYVVRALAGDGARGARSLAFRIDGERADLVLELMTPSATLRGVVVREEGTAVVGRVHVVPESLRWGRGDDDEAPAVDRGEPLADPRDASTDASGAFEVVGLTPGPYRLEVEDGDTRGTVSVWIPRPEGLRVVLPARGPEVVGTVADRATGQAIADATIVWSAWNASGSLERTFRTDASGRFALLAAPGGWLSIHARGYAARSLSVGRDELPEARFLLDRTVRIRGRATFADDGRPAAGLVVEASSAPASRGFTRPHARTTTDAEGRYLMDGLSPGEVSVRVHDAKGIARGMSDLSLEDLEYPLEYDPLSVSVAPGGEGTLDLTIEPPARIVGRLTEAAGAPIAGVLVTASRPGVGHLHAYTPPSYWRIGHAVPDADGRFTLGDLLPGWTYDVVAIRGAEAASASASASTDPASSPLALTFARSDTFEVRVVDDGTGVGVAGVDLRASTAHARGGTWRGRSGDDGFVQVGPLAGEEIQVRSGDVSKWILEPETVTIPLSEQRLAEPRVLRVRRAKIETEARLGASMPQSEVWVNGRQLPSGGGGTSNPLTVRVVDASGAPVPRADLDWHLKVDGSGTGGSVPVIDGVATVPRSADPVVSAWVSVSRPRGAEETPLPLGSARAGPIADATGSITLRLPATPWVEGRVLDEAGRGLAGLRLRLVVPGTESTRGPDDDTGVDRTDASGHFRLVGLGDDEQCLILPALQRFACVAPIPVPRGGAPIEVRLRLAVVARITVTNPDGGPAPGLEVRAWDFRPTVRGISNVDWSSRSAYGTTDAQGVATLEGLDPEGTYSLYVKGSRDGGAEKEVRRDGWKPAETAIRLRGERDLRGIVRDPAGKPLAGAHIVAFVDRRWVAGATSGNDGTFALHDDGQEGLRLYATMSNGQGPASEPVAAPEGGELVTLTLDPGVELSVRVVGAAVARRTVVLTSDPSSDWRDNGEFQHGKTDEGGRVRFRGLRPGVGYAIWVAPQKASWLQIDAAADESTAFVRDVRGGLPAPEVEVRLEPGLVLVARAPSGASWSGPSMTARRGLLSVDGTQRPDGAFEFRGLLDLEWDVVVEAWGGGQRYAGRGRPGADVSLERTASTGGR